MEWETLSTPGLVNLVNQLVCTLDNSTNGGPTLPAKQNQNPLGLCYYCKKPGHWKRRQLKPKHRRHLQPSKQPFQCPPNPTGQALRNYRGLFPSLPFNRLGETTLRMGNESLCPH